MSQLEQLFTAYGTDKGTWGYTPAYERHLGPLRNTATRVLEIGICGYRDIPNNVVGASLFAWRDYFPLAHIYGLDNDNRFIFNDRERIHTALCNAYDVSSLAAALSTFRYCAGLAGEIDFICDDAVHDPLPQVRLMQMLWPMLRKGGVYAIEEACPYKCPGNALVPMVSIMQNLFPGEVTVDEYQTHKDERLLILTKA